MAAVDKKASLFEIIEAVRDGERPDYEDLRYAICALEALTVFDQQALMKLARAERDGKTPFMNTSAIWQWTKHFERNQRAMSKHPKDWVGWNNDPDNIEFLERRQQAKKLLAKAEAFAESPHPAEVSVPNLVIAP